MDASRHILTAVRSSGSGEPEDKCDPQFPVRSIRSIYVVEFTDLVTIIGWANRKTIMWCYNSGSWVRSRGLFAYACKYRLCKRENWDRC